MNLLAAVTIVIAWCTFLSNLPQNPPVSKTQSLSELEKRVLADTQRILAHELDADLPRLPLVDWVSQVVGPGAGVVWQLSECGEITGASSDSTRDLRACVEVNSVLPDDRKVIVMITIGTFKKGITGAPAFYFAVIEQSAELYTVRRLRDLPKLLWEPGSLVNKPAVKLPTVEIPKVRLAVNDVDVAKLLARSGGELEAPMMIEAPPAPQPPQVNPKPSTATSTMRNQSASEGVLQGAAVVKAQPIYPPSARRFNASGPVEVQVTISQTGRVINAKAVSGHPLLRDAAVEAARKWVFEPTTIGGVPVETQTVLTFVFTVP